jgi:hypothetical protein
MSFLRWSSVALLAALPCAAQFYPQGSQVISYFPQLTDGGPAGARWITALTFVNPHQSITANAQVYLYNDNGSPLALNFGSGPVSTFSFAIPAQGSITFKSTGASSTAVGGWAVVASTLPLQGVVQYTYSSGGVSQQISVQATPASHLFRSPATFGTAIALANQNVNAVSLNVSLLDSSGRATAFQTSVTLPALGHVAFNLFQRFSSLSSGFQGSVVITRTSAMDFLALTISADGTALSAFPPAGLNWPLSQPEVIYKVWYQVLNSANSIVTLNPPPKLVIDSTTTAINSFANPSANEVHIFLNLAELISDSESELAFAIGHELGHIIQGKVGLQFVPNNIEFDADQWGLLLAARG